MRIDRSSARLAAAGIAIAILAAACSSPSRTPAPSSPPAASSAASASGDMAALIAAAKAEGGLTTIALPRSWCNYGALIDGFTARYGIQINDLNPYGSSQQELDAIIANRANKGPGAPDVIDLLPPFGPQAITDGLLAAYKVSTWAEIPAAAKDASGYWYGDYYGVMAFEVNAAIVTNVPPDWSDLLNAGKKSVSLAGDPTESSEAYSAVYAAALANGGSPDNAQPGLDFFRKLNDAGILAPVIGKTATVASGETPIRIVWTYAALADKDSLKGTPPITVVVPRTGRLAGHYVQAISAYAPHPNAAKLWMEYLYSNDGQLGLLKGYCSPIRYDALVRANAIPADIAAKQPDTSGAVLLSPAQITRAKAVITSGWATSVGVTVH